MQEPTQYNTANAPKFWHNKFAQVRQAPLALFAREILANPRTVGAALPSSDRLARAMAAQVPKHDDRLVLELGAGTGVITQALTQHLDPARIVSIEVSAHMSLHLQQRFPHIQVIHGDACYLKELLGDQYHRIGSIVSGLPFRSLPRSVVHGISTQLHPLLATGATLIQFTYDLRGRSIPHLESRLGLQLRRVNSQIVWRNFPPARVDVFQI
jgi:phospholipid N-methyltransferase